MKRISTVCVLAACSAVASVAGASDAHAQTCRQASAPYISVQVVDPRPTVSSTKSLQQINDMADSHGMLQDGFRVLGMTEAQVERALNVQFKGLARGGVTCVEVDTVKVTFGLKRHNVHVPREYPRGSCRFTVVMRHEMAHVDVNRRTMRKYADILRNKIRSVLRRSGVVAASSMAEGQAVQQERLMAVIEEVTAAFKAERKRLHAQIDAPESRYAARDQCRGW